ncbi:MAG: proline dehydrogenase [Sphingomonadales bacterium]|nr:proline dehydrogenase [Sphingomonadales bacterium]MBD3774305.1 proline dehydrogenase [Paracoccaceae bacterium]
MNGALAGRLRTMRYALPGHLGRIMPEMTPEAAARACAAFARRGIASSAGYFAHDDDPPEVVVAAYRALAARLQASGCDTVLALKGPQLGFDELAVRDIVAQGLPLIVDALTHDQASRALALAQAAGAGLALPARWARSMDDAAALRDAPCRVRLVKGEWADPGGDPPDVGAAYLQLARRLAGRGATVGVATHDPSLAEAALGLLRQAGTPVELEQLRGLPRRRTMAIARRWQVPVRLYQPFGPGWWPYAIEQALRRPYLPWWALRDLVG